MNIYIVFIIIFVIIKLFQLTFCWKKKIYRKKTLKTIHYLPNVTKERRYMFTELLMDIKKLIKWCKENEYPTVKNANLLSQNWEKVIVNETSYLDHIAYVIDKNKKFYLCISTPDGSIEDKNTMRYVVFHELAHMMSTSYGHNQEFFNHFLAILRVGVHLGIYEPINYTKNPVTYCGTKITNSPCEFYNCNALL